MNLTEIGKEIGRHRTTISKIIKKNNIEVNPQPKRTSNDEKECIICGKLFIGTRDRCDTCDTCNTKIRRHRAKKASVDYLGGKCVNCGWSSQIKSF